MLLIYVDIILIFFDIIMIWGGLHDLKQCLCIDIYNIVMQQNIILCKVLMHMQIKQSNIYIVNMIYTEIVSILMRPINILSHKTWLFIKVYFYSHHVNIEFIIFFILHSFPFILILVYCYSFMLQCNKVIYILPN